MPLIAAFTRTSSGTGPLLAPYLTSKVSYGTGSYHGIRCLCVFNGLDGNRSPDNFAVNLRGLDNVRTKIREILQKPHDYPEEMNFFTSLRQFQCSMTNRSVQGEKMPDRASSGEWVLFHCR